MGAGGNPIGCLSCVKLMELRWKERRWIGVGACDSLLWAFVPTA